MVDYKKLISWLLNNGKHIQLKVFFYKQIGKWLPDFYDCAAEIKICDKEFRGRALDANEEMAFIRACVEAIEHFVCCSLKLKNSSGLAGHIDKKRATENAINELVERDRFFCHYLTKTPFYELDNSKLVVWGTAFPEIYGKLYEANVDLKLFEMKRIDKFCPVVCISSGGKLNPPYGCVVGLGCSKNTNTAKQKAIAECLMNTVFEINRSVRNNIMYDDFICIEQPKAQHHYRLALSMSSRKYFECLFENRNSDKAEQTEKLPLIDCKFISFQQELEFLKDSPLCFCLAHSDYLQKTFFGQTGINEVNLERLSKFAGKKIGYEDIEKYPHPLG